MYCVCLSVWKRILVNCDILKVLLCTTDMYWLAYSNDIPPSTQTVPVNLAAIGRVTQAGLVVPGGVSYREVKAVYNQTLYTCLDCQVNHF